MKAKKRGFTLIELIVVIIIAGILSAVATPIMMSLKTRAACSEAITTLGAIRTAVKAFQIDHPNDTISQTEIRYAPQLGIRPEDIEGTYFSSNTYMVSVHPGTWSNYVQIYITAGGIRPNVAPRANEVAGLGDYNRSTFYIRMYLQTGNIYQSGASKTGYPQDDPGSSR